jgi:hypothetical protein
MFSGTGWFYLPQWARALLDSVMNALKWGAGVVVIDEVKPTQTVLRTAIDASLPTVPIVCATVRTQGESRVRG